MPTVFLSVSGRYSGYTGSKPDCIETTALGRISGGSFGGLGGARKKSRKLGYIRDL